MGPGKISWAISGRQPRTGMLSASKKRLSEDPAGGYENMARDHLVAQRRNFYHGRTYFFAAVTSN